MKRIIRLTESDLTRIVKRVVNENEEDMIRIPSKYDGVRMEFGKRANPQDIIDMYNELVASEGDSVRLEIYEDGYFWNEVMDDIMVDVILDQLNYAIVGEEETDLNSDSEGNKIGRQSYDLLDEHLPKMTTNQRFKLYQTIQNFVTKEKDKY
jgi:hypothetical protein